MQAVHGDPPATEVDDIDGTRQIGSHRPLVVGLIALRMCRDIARSQRQLPVAILPERSVQEPLQIPYWHRHDGEVGRPELADIPEECEAVAFEQHTGPQGELWGCRLEIYETDPTVEPDMNPWTTTLSFRLAD